MTNEEAIYILIDHFWKRNFCTITDAEDAINMAITALSNSSQPIIPKRIVSNYTDEIDMRFINWEENNESNKI